MKTHDLIPTLVDAHNFAGFGSTFRYPSPEGDRPMDAPTSTGTGFRWFGRLLVERFGADLSFGMVYSEAGVLVQDEFERHIHTPELMVPLDGDVLLVLGQAGSVARPFLPEHGDGRVPAVTAEKFRAFLVPQGQLIAIGPGVWHKAPLALDKPSRTLVAFANQTENKDTECIALADVGVRFCVDDAHDS